MKEKIHHMHSHYYYVVIIVLTIICMCGVHFKVSEENRDLDQKIEKMESDFNKSHDRIRLIFFKHRAEFIDMATYLQKNYGNFSYRIEYQDGSILKKGTSVQQDDDKFIRFFGILQKEIVLYKERPGSNKMEITHYPNEEGENEHSHFFTKGINFYLYKSKRYSARIRYGNATEFDYTMNIHEYMAFYKIFSIIEFQWGSMSLE